MKSIPIREAEGQLGQLVAEAWSGETIMLTDGDRRVTLEPRALDLEEDSSELEAELLKAVNGPHAPMRGGELREIADKALREHRAKQRR